MYSSNGFRPGMEEKAMQNIEALWADFAQPIVTADDYLASLRGGRMNVYFMGERVPETVDHPVIRPSINAMAETYRLATERPELASAKTEIGGCQTNRFLHVPASADDLVAKHEMQRELGRRTGTCFQRCVGLDAIGTCHSVTFDVDAKGGTDYHARFLALLRRAQAANVVIGGAMTDPKGDRSKAPHQQSDPDLFAFLRLNSGPRLDGRCNTGCKALILRKCGQLRCDLPKSLAQARMPKGSISTGSSRR